MMSKTVSVTSRRQYFDRFLQKHFTKPTRTLVHDPAEILVEGDVIEYVAFEPEQRRLRLEKGKGKRVKFVLKAVVTPFGSAVEDRVGRGELG